MVSKLQFVVLLLSVLHSESADCNAFQDEMSDKTSVSLLQLSLQMNGGQNKTRRMHHKDTNTDREFQVPGPLQDGWLEKVLYINVDSRTDRNAVMQKQFERFPSMSFERFAAITNDSITDNPMHMFSSGIRITDPKRHTMLHSKVSFMPSMKMLPGHGVEFLPADVAKLPHTFWKKDIWQYMSQRTLWERIARGASEPNAERKWHLILEDDIILPQGWADRMTSLLQNSHISADWTAVRFNTWHFTRAKDLVQSLSGEQHPDSEGYRSGLGPQHHGLYRASGPYYDVSNKTAKGFTNWYMGNHAVLVTAASAARLLKYIDSVPMTYVDPLLVEAPGSYVIMDCGLPLVSGHC